ncbi:MAG: cyclic nucleotide-binding domain-containing protein [Candidatus Wallbacteria bacterium]|nr:cyclic nucleotide-binding domain-containing protein [Candidatus Wallbacteria bacterium]
MITTDMFQILRDLVFFQDFSDRELQSFLSICTDREFKQGEIIFHEGVGGDEFYIIVTGEVAIMKETESGQKELLSILETGSVFGEMSIIDSSPRSAGSEVASDKANLLVIKRAFLEELAKSDLDLAVKLMLTLIKYISERLRQTTERFALAQKMLRQMEN